MDFSKNTAWVLCKSLMETCLVIPLHRVVSFSYSGITRWHVENQKFTRLALAVISSGDDIKPQTLKPTTRWSCQWIKGCRRMQSDKCRNRPGWRAASCHFPFSSCIGCNILGLASLPVAAGMTKTQRKPILARLLVLSYLLCGMGEIFISRCWIPIWNKIDHHWMEKRQDCLGSVMVLSNLSCTPTPSHTLTDNVSIFSFSTAAFHLRDDMQLFLPLIFKSNHMLS